MTAVIAISGTRRAIRELADGTIRVQIDVDPLYRKDFHRLFGEIDMAVALTPLIEGRTEEEPAVSATPGKADAVAAASKPAGGKGHFPDGLCGLAVRWCADPHFQDWLLVNFPDETARARRQTIGDEAVAKLMVCMLCMVNSRKEIDTDDTARETFNSVIRLPYAAHRKESGLGN